MPQPKSSPHTDLTDVARSLLCGPPKADMLCCPSVEEVSAPTTVASRAAMAIVTHAIAALLERHTGKPHGDTQANAAEARVLISAFLRTYRRIALQQRAEQGER